MEAKKKLQLFISQFRLFFTSSDTNSKFLRFQVYIYIDIAFLTFSPRILRLHLTIIIIFSEWNKFHSIPGFEAKTRKVSSYNHLRSSLIFSNIAKQFLLHAVSSSVSLTVLIKYLWLWENTWFLISDHWKKCILLTGTESIALNATERARAEYGQVLILM